MESISFMEADLYFECIDIIESRKTLSQITASNFSEMKKEARNKVHKDLYKRAFPNIFKETRQISLGDIANILGSVKNG